MILDQDVAQTIVDSLLRGATDRSATEADIRRVLNDDQLPQELRAALARAVARTPMTIGDDLRLTAGDIATP